MNSTREQRAIGALLGLAVGDAVGTTLEFRQRDTYEHITDMVGGGPFRLEPGVWTDDTSMALALADSLANCGTVVPKDLMKRFVKWWRKGEYSATGTCFDIGGTTKSALNYFEARGKPLAGSRAPDTAGNGSLMRLAPIAIWGIKVGDREMRKGARLQSETTHAAPACLDACEGYAVILRAAIEGTSKMDAMRAAAGMFSGEIGTILDGSWEGKTRDEIKSGGYVAHSLKAALWCVSQSEGYRDTILLAANLGGDADTTAAIAGQLAGALWGVDGIPREWRERVAWGDRIQETARRLIV